MGLGTIDVEPGYPRLTGASGRRVFAALSTASLSPMSLAVVTTGILSLLYLRWAPLSPDLAAQVARATVVQRAGNISWWTGWFGGISMPNYSVLAPSWMATVGVRAAGVIAVLGGTVATATLVRSTPRPRLGALAFGITAMADLIDGRVTFAFGLAIAAWALVAIRGRWWALSVILGLATYLASPLAGLFLGLIVVAIAVVDRPRARLAWMVAGGLLTVGLAMAMLFPGTGTMPFTFADAIPAWLCGAGVVLVCPQRLVRVSAILVLLAFPVFLVVPGAVGDNITRLSWVCAVPVVAACAPLPRRVLAFVLALLAIWPIADLSQQLWATSNPSTRRAFYTPLIAQVLSRSGGESVGDRIEVLDPDNHWASVYLSTLSLARGWDRQADDANNPIFYQSDALDTQSYHQWLTDLAVAWVAVPDVPLDYASRAEAQLVASAPAYLSLAWSSPQWKLYRVTDPQPLASGGTVTAVSAGSITVRTTSASLVSLRVRWSPYLQAVSPSTGTALPACVSDADGWVQLYVSRAGDYQLVSRFNPAHRLDPDADCVPYLQPSPVPSGK